MIEELLEKIDALTVAELAELVKAIEEEYNDCNCNVSQSNRVQSHKQEIQYFTEYPRNRVDNCIIN